MTSLSLLVAALLLFFGQRLYWLFVAAVGFLVGMDLAAKTMANQPAWLIVGVAILAGCLGAVLAIFFQRLAIAVAGFMAGGYLAQAVAPNLDSTISAQGSVVIFIMGGVVAAIIALVFLDRALIGISAVLGAAMIAKSLVADPLWRTVLFAALFIVGAAVQLRILRGVRRTATYRSAPP